MAIPENPITRKETFLAKAAGQDVSLPEDTLTREEAYLREIAEGGGGKGGGIPISQIKDLSAFDEVVNTDSNMNFQSAVTALGNKIDNLKVTTNTKVYFVMQSGKGFYCLSLISYGENNFKYYFGAENAIGGNYPALMQVNLNGTSNMYIGGSLVNGQKIYSYSYNGFLANIIAIGIIYQ